jgi:conjugative relaxase-like TrwC/TraI family protein
MMRPKAIKGAGALDYYAQLVPKENGLERWELGQAEGRGAVEDYYLPLGESPGTWFGEGAARLGLAGDGRRDQMAALLAGCDPRTGESLGQRPRPDGVRAYDLTFSAPKGVSILAGIVGGETERQVVASHDAAVTAALGVLEERATTRAGKNGIHRLDAGGLTSLLVRHRTSRSLDPQLHTHALVFAKVRATDGRWRALDASIVFRAQRLFGAAYQSALRSEMTTRLGVEWGAVDKGQAEVDGLDPELLAAFSRRSEQVAKAAERRFAAWRREHPGREPSERERAIIVRDAARASRPRKDHSRTSDELRADHLAVAEALGWDGERVSNRVLGRAGVTLHRDEISAPDVAGIAGDVVRALSSERSVWSREHLERAVLERLPHVDGRDARSQLREAQRIASEVAGRRCVDLVELAGSTATSGPLGRSVMGDASLERYTTRELLEQEQRILRWFERAAAGGGEPAGIEGLAAPPSAASLDPEQARAAALAAGTDRAVVIVGPAGTGKTKTLKPVVEALHAGGRDVFGLAPTAVAAETLNRDTGVASENIAMFLTLYDGGAPPERVALRPGGTLLIDEAGMMGTADLERLLQVASKRDLRVVLVGDGRQLFAVGRGGMFDKARELLPTVEFGQVYRFREEWEGPASLALRAGKTDAITAYAEHGRIRSGTADEMNTAMVEDYLAARQIGQSTAFSVATNEQARHLNNLVRERLLASGALKDDRGTVVRGGQRVGVGDEVATRENDWRLRTDRGVHVKNRHRWAVESVGDDGSVSVSDATRGRVTLPGEYVREQAELAYFRTTHGVQSLTQDVGGSLVDGGTGFRDLYVGMTRGRRTNTAYVVVEPEQTTEQVLESALRRDRADLGVLAVCHRISDELLMERQRQARVPAANSERTTLRATQCVPDAMAPHRGVLGDAHSKHLAEQAAAFADRSATQDRAALISARDDLAVAWQRLDRAGARETRSLQRDRQLAEDRAAAARAAARKLEQSASEVRGVRGRRERQTIGQAAAAQRRNAETEQGEADVLALREHRLHADGRHLDDWIEQHGEHAAAWLAAEQELARRRELAVAEQLRSVSSNPPEHILEQIGGPPPLDDALRAEWENLALRLEHDRLVTRAAIADGSAPGYAPDDGRGVERRVRRLRADLGLGQLSNSLEAEV